MDESCIFWLKSDEKHESTRSVEFSDENKWSKDTWLLLYSTIFILIHTIRHATVNNESSKVGKW